MIGNCLIYLRVFYDKWPFLLSVNSGFIRNMEITKVCRGCMKEVASWEKDNFDVRAVEMFCFCTNIRIPEEDRLPKQFCYDCVIKIESSYTFITEAQKVNVTLKNIVSRTSTVIVEPDSIKLRNLEMKLTLPDYKISSVIENDFRQSLDLQNNPTEIGRDSPENFDSTEVIHNEVGSDVPEIAVENEENKNNLEINSIEVKKNVCLVCQKSFTSKTWYEKHMKKEHSGKKYVCTHCPKSFSRPSQLSYHSISHSEERKFSCPTCGKTFKRKKQLQVHKQGHTDSRPYGCDKCTARFKSKSVLKSHMAVHDESKSFLCYCCGWSFAQAGNLRVHMRTHTGEKPFACGACPFRAAAASNLRRHARRHAAAAALACARCGRRFNDASNLRRHTRTHTGELPYRCERCDAAFGDSWKRKTHLMTAHHLPLHHIPRTDARARTQRTN